MGNPDKEQFAAVMATLGIAFDKAITEPIAEVYWKALSDLSIDQVKSAAIQLMKHSKFFPRVADFYEAVEGDGQDQAQRAWAVMTEAVGDIGGYTSLCVPDPALSYAIEKTFGGWVECCERLPTSDHPMYANLNKQFVAHYRHAKRTGAGAPLYMVGRCEASNRLLSGTFERGDPMADDNGELCIRQKVGAIIAGKIMFVNANFSYRTGALTEQSRRFLKGSSQFLTEGGEISASLS